MTALVALLILALLFLRRVCLLALVRVVASKAAAECTNNSMMTGNMSAYCTYCTAR